MLYLTTYRSPLGPMTLVARTGADLPEGGALVGAWFDGQRHDRAGLDRDDEAPPVVVGAGDDDEPAVLARTRACNAQLYLIFMFAQRYGFDKRFMTFFFAQAAG